MKDNYRLISEILEKNNFYEKHSYFNWQINSCQSVFFHHSKFLANASRHVVVIEGVCTHSVWGQQI